MTTTQTTRGGHRATGTAADRRASTASTNGVKSQRTRDELLDAARRSFARWGYANTTVERIVDEAGLARGSFYTYFESKADLFRHLVNTIERDIAAQVATITDAQRGDVVGNLLQSNRNYLRVVAANADLYRLVEEMAAHDHEVRANREKSRRRHVRRVADTIRRWQANGRADRGIDPDLTAAALVAMLSGFAQSMHATRTASEDDIAARRLTDIWVAACGLRLDESGDR